MRLTSPFSMATTHIALITNKLNAADPFDGKKQKKS